jgi:alkyl sulfatase BDS1-like metallo-beta-lactamase superfamily hydrolase
MSSLNLNRRDGGHGRGEIICSSAQSRCANCSTAGEPASPSTPEFNKNSTASLPWSDKADFANAKRGLIARLPDNGVIRDKNGSIVWDLSRFTGFIKDEAPAPDTVNPSLWRISQLLMDAGLYEVVSGIY